jgi:hypothetical protein
VFAVLVALVTDPALATEAHNAMEKYTWLVWVAGILVSSLKARALRAPRRAASEDTRWFWARENPDGISSSFF